MKIYQNKDKYQSFGFIKTSHSCKNLENWFNKNRRSLTSIMTGPRKFAFAGPSSSILLARASPSFRGGGWTSLSFFKYLHIYRILYNSPQIFTNYQHSVFYINFKIYEQSFNSHLFLYNVICDSIGKPDHQKIYIEIHSNLLQSILFFLHMITIHISPFHPIQFFNLDYYLLIPVNIYEA